MKQSISKSGTLVWEDKFDTYGTAYDAFSVEGKPLDQSVREALEVVTALSHQGTPDSHERSLTLEDSSVVNFEVTTVNEWTTELHYNLAAGEGEAFDAIGRLT